MLRQKRQPQLAAPDAIVIDSAPKLEGATAYLSEPVAIVEPFCSLIMIEDREVYFWRSSRMSGLQGPLHQAISHPATMPSR